MLITACICLDQYINVDMGERTKFTNDLDSYPIVKVKPLSHDDPLGICKFGTSYFQPGLSKAVHTIDDTDHHKLDGYSQIFNFNNSNFGVWQNTSDMKIWSIALRNFAQSREEIEVFSCKWDGLGSYQPTDGENIIISTVIDETNRDFLKEDLFLVNRGKPGDPSQRSYFVKFKILQSTGCVDAISVSLIDHFFTTHDTIYLKSQILAYRVDSTLKIDKLEINNTLTSLYSYNTESIGLNMKDFYMMNDNKNVLVIESRFGGDLLYITDFAKFMKPGSVKTVFQCLNMSFIITAMSNILVQCVEKTNVNIYYLKGINYDSYIFKVMPLNTTSPVQRAEQLEGIVMVWTVSSENYFLFKDYNETGFFNYSIFSVDGKGFLYTDFNSTDLQTMSAVISFNEGGGNKTLATTEYGYASLDIGSMLVCTLPNISMTLKFEVDTLLNTSYKVTLTRRSSSPEQSLSTLVKNIMITATIVLAMLLVLGSFWLMSKKTKEEDNALEEFKLDYIKFSNKRNLNDSSSLINHDVN